MWKPFLIYTTYPNYRITGILNRTLVVAAPRVFTLYCVNCDYKPIHMVCQENSGTFFADKIHSTSLDKAASPIQSCLSELLWSLGRGQWTLYGSPLIAQKQSNLRTRVFGIIPNIQPKHPIKEIFISFCHLSCLVVVSMLTQRHS